MYPTRQYFLLGNSPFLLSRRHFENSAGGGLGSTILGPR